MMDFASAEINRILQDVDSNEPRSAVRYLLTGDSGVGKTRWCEALIKAAHGKGLAIGGVVSPGVYLGDRRVGIDLKSLETGETRQLARLRPKIEPDQATKKWEMDQDALTWGNQVFRRLGEVDLLIVDEIGPLELVHAVGLSDALRAVDLGNYRTAIVVVRPSLLETALQRWRECHVVEVPGAEKPPEGET